MDYFTRYGLEFNPFIKNSKEILVDTTEYRETLFRLDYLAKTKGFGILTGNAGRGKTTTVRSWAASLNPSLYKVVYSSLSTLTPNDFYRNLVKELDNEPAFKKSDNFHIIQEEITRLSIPNLNSTLRLQIHEPLRQRIVMNYSLEGLTKDEGKSYILEKLKGAGCNQTIFEDAAVEAILNAADGTPRLINKYCNASMLIGDTNKVNLITTDIVMQALNDCELG